MNPFLWVALALFVLTALPGVLYFGAYVATGQEHLRTRALRFYRWSSLVVLVTFNITIFKHIILTIASF
jgi:hypothetical protein